MLDIQWYLQDSSFILDDTGCIGIAPRGARVGDEIWHIKGACLPCILRQGDHGGKVLISGTYHMHLEIPRKDNGGLTYAYSDVLTLGVEEDIQIW
jgi:hypothetical protein